MTKQLLEQFYPSLTVIVRQIAWAIKTPLNTLMNIHSHGFRLQCVNDIKFPKIYIYFRFPSVLQEMSKSCLRGA